LNSLEEINDFVKDNYLLEDEVEEEIRAKIPIILAQISKEEFINQFRQVYTFQFEHNVEVIYEALILNEDDDSIEWDTFFAEEYERGFKVAEKSNIATNLYDLSVIYGYQDSNIELCKRVAKTCSKFIWSKHTEIRLIAIEHLGDWLSSLQKKSGFYPVMQDLRTMLKDKKRKIRLRTYETLEELNYLPQNYKLGLLDRIFYRRIEKKKLSWKN